MRVIRASEIGAYVYCRRAWWYALQGEPSENQAEMAAGTALHASHGRKAFTAGCLSTLAYALLLAAVIILALYLTGQVL